MKVYKPPQNIDNVDFDKSVFLAGSIEMGKAEEWQDKLINALKDDDINILNPRRDDWDSSWEQTIENKNFREQVEWELKGLDRCRIIALYFDPDTKSPISLLELGLYARTKPIVVYCPHEFYRKGNVDIVCDKHNIGVYEDYNEFQHHVKFLVKWINKS